MCVSAQIYIRLVGRCVWVVVVVGVGYTRDYRLGIYFINLCVNRANSFGRVVVVAPPRYRGEGEGDDGRCVCDYADAR